MPPRRPAKVSASIADGPQSESTSLDDSQDHSEAHQIEVDSLSSSARPKPVLETLQRTSSSSSSHFQNKPGRPIARPRGVGRRSQQGRAELEKAELERKQAEAASRAQPRTWQKRDIGGGSRGASRGRMRGGYVGEGVGRSDNAAVISGPFSLGQVTKSKSRRAHEGITREAAAQRLGGGGGSAAAKTQTSARRVKQELSSAGDTLMNDHNVEDGGYISSDADDEHSMARKVNVDLLVDLTGEDEAGGNAVHLPPVRIQRHEHKTSIAVANAEGSSVGGTGAHGSFHSDRRRIKQRAAPTSAKQRYRGTYTDSSSEDEVQVKQEHTAGTVRNLSNSPDARRSTKSKARAGSLALDAPSFQTKEEELEWSIHQHDLRVLQSELGHLSMPQTNGESQDAEDPRADKMYLFQFPAILPALAAVDPKQEDRDVDMRDIPEAGAAISDTASMHGRAKSGTPSGMVGRLRVHKSGRAYLDWGGIPMEVSMAQETSFLQDVVILDPPAAKSAAQQTNNDQAAGKMMSMGQVKGRFVVVPQWDAIFDQVY